MIMDERKQKILQAIIDCYIASAEPIGSRTISRRYGFGLSPATIRNEMSDLEESGYLEQPYTSAGRIPSQKGYRFYVDCLMGKEELKDEEIKLIKSGYETNTTELEYFIQLTSKMLSCLTNYTAVALKPDLQKSRLKHLQLLPITRNQVLIVLITDTGLVENRLIELPQTIDEDSLYRISNFLTQKFKGLSAEQINQFCLNKLERDFLRYQEVIAEVLQFLQQNFTSSYSERIFLGGATNMLFQPEFRDLEKARAILDLLEQDELVFHLMAESSDDGVSVTIGDEIKHEEMKDCSVVTANYKIGERRIGTIGIIGPTRMEYSKVIAVVDLTAKVLTKVLTEIFK